MIVPPDDAEALGRALLRLVEEPERRRAMGRAGRAIALARFDARRNAEQLVDVIHTGIARWRGRQAPRQRIVPANLTAAGS
jgi:glycosyltransferase involved in cell wall biosynthesis